MVAWHSEDTISGLTDMDTHSDGPDVSGSVPCMLGTLVGGGGDRETGPKIYLSIVVFLFHLKIR